MDHAHIDTPELLYGVKGDDFLEEIIPVVTLDED